VQLPPRQVSVGVPWIDWRFDDLQLTAMATSASDTFETHLFEQASVALGGVAFPPVHPEAAKRGKPQSPADVYALSFYLSGEDDDPRRMILEISFNTHARADCCAPGPGKQDCASSAQEAKWNYAFWLQEPIASIGQDDTPTASRREHWIRDEGLAYTDEEEDEDFAATVERGAEIERRFWQLATRVAKRLHETGVIARIFGRPIPIVIHDLEYSAESIEATRSANPAGLAAEYLAGY
jgi:hypothetical protein